MVESVNDVPESAKFSVSLLTFWIKGSMTVDKNFIHINMPNTVLFGTIAAGNSRDNSPLQGITNVYTSKEYKVGLMGWGALIALIGLVLFGTSFLAGLVLLLVGVALFLSGIRTRFSYERSGVVKNIDVPFFEANHVQEFAEQVQKAISGYQEDRNVRVQAENTIKQSQKNTQQIVDAVHGNDEA